MSWSGPDRRASKRYGVKESLLVYRKGGLLAFLRPPSPVYIVLNLSPGGCHFISREELAAGQPLRLSIQPSGVRGTIRVAGRVVWSRRSEAHDAWHAGVAFAGLSARAAKLVKAALDGALLENIEISTKAYMKQIEKL